jgi:hypothetical protein
MDIGERVDGGRGRVGKGGMDLGREEDREEKNGGKRKKEE